jgi:iron complex outermembrane receptor protein
MVGRVDIALFRTWYKNELQFVNFQALIPAVAPDPPNQGSVGINDNDQIITGVELSTMVRPIPSLTFSLNGAYTNTEVSRVFSPTPLVPITKSDITLPSPRFTGTVAMRWELPYHPLDGNLVFNADVFATSRFGAQGGIDFPGYHVADARLGWLGIAKSNFDVSLFVKNMFDKVYLISPVVLLPSFPVSTGVIGMPRTYGVDLRYSF